MSELAESGAREERRDVIEYVTELLDEHFRHGSANVRIVFDGIPEWDYQEIEGQVMRRYPEGEIKIERPCLELTIEWIRDRGA